ncbi:MAG: 4Fe-4S dicluster domain-containing protein [Nitriliruptoraceae bacterium]
MPTSTGVTTVSVLDEPHLGALLEALREDGYEVVGPTEVDGAIVHGPVTEVADLPQGVGDEQGPGRYELTRSDDDAWFGYAVGPSSAKRRLLPPRHPLWTAQAQDDASFAIDEAVPPPSRTAFLGLKPCEAAAIAIQDRVLLQGPVADEVYAANRDDVLLIAVECQAPAATCFCPSMGTGPGLELDGEAAHPAAGLVDLVLTELPAPTHKLLARAGTERGRDLLERLDAPAATDDDLAARDRVLTEAAERIRRHLDADAVHDLLLGNLEHPHWDAIAERCLACANCTLVCPTCFCTTVEDRTDLAGTTASRERRWDSCFSLEFTHTGPSSVRTTTRARYRQWLTHKLATWTDQFGTSGCVGCGRCIAWCPVGIDLTEEVATIRRTSEDTGAAWPLVPSGLREG